MALETKDIPATQIITPATRYAEITPADSDLDDYCRGIYVGVAGNLTVMDVAGNLVTFTAVPAGSLLPIVAMQIRSTDTTATDIVAVF